MELPEHNNIIQLEIPQSDEIFYFNHDVYDESLHSSHISKEKFNFILTECEKVVCQSHVKKERYDKQDLKLWIYILGIITLITFIIFLIILYYTPRYKHCKDLYWTSITFGLIGIIIIIIILLYNLLNKKVIGKDIDDFVSEDLEIYLSSIQKQLHHGIKFNYDKKRRMIIMSYPNNVIKKSKSKRNEYALLSDQNLLNSNDNRNYNFLDVNSNNNIDSEYHKLNKTNGKKKGE